MVRFSPNPSGGRPFNNNNKNNVGGGGGSGGGIGAGGGRFGAGGTPHLPPHQPQPPHQPSVPMSVRRSLSRFWASYNASLAQRPLLTKCLTGVVGTVLGDFIAQVTQYQFTRATAQKAASAAASSTAAVSHHQQHGGAVGVGGSSARGSGKARKGGGGGVADKEHDEDDKYDSKQSGKKLRFSYDVERMLRLCLWSAFVGTPIGHVWFMFLDKNVFPHAPTSTAGVVTKMLMDQCIMAPAGTALFFYGFKRLMEGGTHEEARANLVNKFVPTMTANYVLWPAANLVNFRFIPPEQRILYVNIIALFWTAFMSHMASKEAPGAPSPPHHHMRIHHDKPIAAGTGSGARAAASGFGSGAHGASRGFASITSNLAAGVAGVAGAAGAAASSIFSHFPSTTTAAAASPRRPSAPLPPSAKASTSAVPASVAPLSSSPRRPFASIAMAAGAPAGSKPTETITEANKKRSGSRGKPSSSSDSGGVAAAGHLGSSNSSRDVVAAAEAPAGAFTSASSLLEPLLPHSGSSGSGDYGNDVHTTSGVASPQRQFGSSAKKAAAAAAGAQQPAAAAAAAARL